MRSKLRKGIAQVLLANAINLIISVFNGFIIPKFLSIPTYANYKTFLLYTSYVGILHFGFIDGVYIRYGGKNLEELSRKELSSIQKTLFVFQFLITAIGVIVSPFIHDIYLFIAVLCVMPTNLQMFFRILFQATGEFKQYRRILNAQSITVFVFNILLILALRNDDARVYAIGYFVISVIVWLLFAYDIRDLFVKTTIKLVDIVRMLKEYIGLGMIIMFGNFMSIWITSIDRWFVKFRCSENEFAYYSFAVSMLKLVNAVFGAFSVTLYNYFCEHHNNKQVKDIRKKIIIIGAIIVSCSFPLRLVVDVFLTKYIPSETVMMYLILSQLFVVIINSIYMNLYKALNLQKRYLRIMIETSIIAVVANFIFGWIFDFSMVSFSYATFLTMFIWLCRCQIDLREYRLETREWIYVILTVCIFFISCRFTSIIGFISYLALVFLVALVMFKDDMMSLLHMSISLVRRGKH
ncbi:MAG: hypothetical protein IJ058_14480 [Lachnospiraceae bacterium]|nr:hypothetical protein [Lachnospiraceae bacterium]MBQ8947988.1 hypothetical protein [Lachnospiraceae bacterium]